MTMPNTIDIAKEYDAAADGLEKHRELIADGTIPVPNRQEALDRIDDAIKQLRRAAAAIRANPGPSQPGHPDYRPG